MKVIFKDGIWIPPRALRGGGGGWLDVGRKCCSLCMGVVARYLRSVGAALHSPTWLPTALLRATFLTPESSQNHVPVAEFGSRTARTLFSGSFVSVGVKVC